MRSNQTDGAVPSARCVQHGATLAVDLVALDRLDAELERLLDAEQHLTQSLADLRNCIAHYQHARAVLWQAIARESEPGHARKTHRDDCDNARGRDHSQHRSAPPRDATAISPSPGRRPHGTVRLTPRERDVLRLIAEGRSNREIASELFISGRTVERHIENLYRKLGIHNKADATAYALTHGMGSPGDPRTHDSTPR